MKLVLNMGFKILDWYWIQSIVVECNFNEDTVCPSRNAMYAVH
jgi:hypothetical protein